MQKCQTKEMIRMEYAINSSFLNLNFSLFHRIILCKRGKYIVEEHHYQFEETNWILLSSKSKVFVENLHDFFLFLQLYFILRKNRDHAHFSCNRTWVEPDFILAFSICWIKRFLEQIAAIFLLALKKIYTNRNRLFMRIVFSSS